MKRLPETLKLFLGTHSSKSNFISRWQSSSFWMFGFLFGEWRARQGAPAFQFDAPSPWRSSCRLLANSEDD